MSMEDVANAIIERDCYDCEHDVADCICNANCALCEDNEEDELDV